MSLADTVGVEPRSALCGGRRARTIAAALVVALSLVSVAAAALAVTAVLQFKSLEVHTATTRAQLIAANEHIAGLERQLEAVLRNFDQQQTLGVRQVASDPGPEKRNDRPAFRLTPEETQLVRTYIKASPVASKPTATISVGGELRNAALLPLPAQIMAKAPRLEGGRFTMDRNGAIIISLRNSRTADAVIQAN